MSDAKTSHKNAAIRRNINELILFLVNSMKESFTTLINHFNFKLRRMFLAVHSTVCMRTRRCTSILARVQGSGALKSGHYKRKKKLWDSEKEAQNEIIFYHGLHPMDYLIQREQINYLFVNGYRKFFLKRY